MSDTKCQTCASCGTVLRVTPDWGRGCARDCTQLLCKPGFIFDWTELVQSAKYKSCGELDDISLYLEEIRGLTEFKERRTRRRQENIDTTRQRQHRQGHEDGHRCSVDESDDK